MKSLNEKIELADIVMRMVRAELIKAWTKHPGQFNNAHEGYAVMLEEVDELWDEVKGDTAYSKAGMKEAMWSSCTTIRKHLLALRRATRTTGTVGT